MRLPEKWIWLPKEQYPQQQTTKYDAFTAGDASYAVAEFQKTYQFEKTVSELALRFSGDTEFYLCFNGETIATGPAVVEGDFIGNGAARPNFYAMEHTVYPESKNLSFYALVKMMPVRICEFSMGHGGFMLSAQVTFSDGTKQVISTDESWQARYNGAYTEPFCYDGRIKPDAYIHAEVVQNIWKTTTAPLLVRQEIKINPDGNSLTVSAGETSETVLEMDMIYPGFLLVNAETDGEIAVEITSYETCIEHVTEKLVFTENGTYRGLQIHSASLLKVKVANRSSASAKVTVSFIATWYPVGQEAKTVTEDAELNRVLSVCAHALKICRQLHHLDSPAHMEPLACTGDYYIETLMNLFAFGDTTLSEFDVLRTAELLRANDGRMFHTTYSLIWVRMLYDVYMITGKKELLLACKEALMLLFHRFASYVGENGLIETPPDYMFVDWIYIDGLSMHHPPKALGQTVLNMFYFSALGYGAKIWAALDESAMQKELLCRQKAVQLAVNTLLYDEEKGMYFEGLNTETPEELLYQYMPQNVEKRYYLPHSNIMAAYVGICDKERARMLIEKVMTGAIEGIYQPYFAHFLLEAIYENGLRETYTLQELEKWKQPVKECSQGLVEGFYPPEPTYRFDRSHAWAGTPLYSLPKALLGLEITQPGMKEITLSPSLLGMKRAEVELQTPYGIVSCKWDENEKVQIQHPEEVQVHLRK